MKERLNGVFESYLNAPRLLAKCGGSMEHMLASLKYRNFRLYFGGQCISVIGTWMQQIAMGWLAYKLTGSVLILATVTFMEQIPMLFATPFMSVWTDRFDRHKLLVLTQTLSMIQALVMAALVLTDTVQVWNLLLLSLCIGLINALDMPTRQAFYTSLVPREELTNAIALNSSAINGCRLIGPAIGGILISWVGEGYCFLINGISYLGVITALLMMHPVKQISQKRSSHLLQEMQEGFSYMNHHFPIRALVMMMATISFFSVPFNSFVPAFVNQMLQGGSEMLGILLSAIGVGSFLASVYLATRRTVIGLGTAVQYAAFSLGITLCLIAFVRIWWLAAVLCVPIGFGIIISVASINTLLQALTADRMRGRIMGYLTMAFAGMPPLGALIFGWIEKWLGLSSVLFALGMGAFVTAVIFTRYLSRIREESYPVFVKKGLVPEVEMIS